jgi:hypothetical protein
MDRLSWILDLISTFIKLRVFILYLGLILEMVIKSVFFYKIYFILLNKKLSIEGPINIVGGGFKDSKKVKCILEGLNYDPIKVTENEVK